VPTHVALLRGINLGAHSRVAMADLRRVVTSLGHTEVATYIQSGNAVFTTQETDSVALAAGLEAVIAEGLDGATGARGTARNWATVTKLLALLDASSAVLVYGADSRPSST